MPESYHINDLPQSNASAQVVEWKSNLESFFREDWSRLRSLIMSLEEDLWAADAEPAGTGSALCHTSPNFALQPKPSVNQSRPDSAPASSVAGAPDQLSELASQIERRLKIMNASKR